MDSKEAVTVDSSTTEQSGTEVLASLTPTQRTKWRQTGDLPEEKSAEKKIEEKKIEERKLETKDSKTDGASSTPEKAAPAKVEEPAKSAVADKSEPQARTRIGRDLVAENKELKAKLEELQRQAPIAVKKDDVSPKPLRNDVDEKTGQAKYATDEAFEEAREKWLTDKVTSDVRKQVAKEENDRRVAEQNQLIEKRVSNSLKIAEQQHADFREVVQVKEEQKDGKTVTTFNAPALKLIKTNGMIDAWLVDTEIGGELLYYFASRAEEVERIQALNAFAAARELTRLEEKLSASPALKKESAESSATPTAKVTGAPAPASSIGGKATAPVDEEEAATQAGDFSRFKKAANEADWRKKKAS